MIGSNQSRLLSDSVYLIKVPRKDEILSGVFFIRLKLKDSLRFAFGAYLF